jgi:hypothetical protein
MSHKVSSKNLKYNPTADLGKSVTKQSILLTATHPDIHKRDSTHCGKQVNIYIDEHSSCDT